MSAIAIPHLHLTNNSAARHATESYAQEGEDLVLRRFFENQRHGFYVDIGAHHPHRFSNTFFFYRRGWRGINVDAMPGSMDAFRAERPNDINVEAAVGTSTESMAYYVFNERALNGLCREVAERRDGKHGNKIVARVSIRPRRLSDILDEHLPAGSAIDFISVDVEGHDLDVVQSNDWSRYRPRIVLVEDLDRRPLDEIEKSALIGYLKEQGYQAWARTFNTVILQRTDE